MIRIKEISQYDWHTTRGKTGTAYARTMGEVRHRLKACGLAGVIAVILKETKDKPDLFLEIKNKVPHERRSMGLESRKPPMNRRANTY